MKKERIYISGAISGRLPEDVCEDFERAEACLWALGWEVVNPLANGLTEAHTWEEHMRADLRLLLDCDRIAMLPGWARSRGASLEWRVARELGMPIIYL